MRRAGNSIPTRTNVLAGSQPPIGVNSTAIYCLHPPMSETMLAKTDRGTQICDCRETRNMTTCPTQTECSQTVQCILISPKRVEGAQGSRRGPRDAKRAQERRRSSPGLRGPAPSRSLPTSTSTAEVLASATYWTRYHFQYSYPHTQHTTLYIYEDEKGLGKSWKVTRVTTVEPNGVEHVLVLEYR